MVYRIIDRIALENNNMPHLQKVAAYLGYILGLSVY